MLCQVCQTKRSLDVIASSHVELQYASFVMVDSHVYKEQKCHTWLVRV
jgi:hypothetical protein